MSGAEESKGRADSPRKSSGVLGNLPNSRPQRSSPRRAAARRTSAKATAVTPVVESTPVTPTAADASKVKARSAPAKARKNAAKRPVSKKPARKIAARAAAPRKKTGVELPPVPRQGFASEGDHATGAVQAPGGTELAGSAAEILGELAKAGLSTGERLLRDIFSRLPGA